MTIQSIIEEISADMLWRYKEIKCIEKIFYSLKPLEKRNIGGNEIITLSTEQKYLLRSSIPMIYAHLEGFIKVSINKVHEYLDYCEIDLNILENKLIYLLGTCFDMKNDNIKFANINFDNSGNINSKNLTKLCQKYFFRQKSFEKFDIKLNHLLKVRNAIAHGENSYYFDSFQSIHEYIIIVFKVMIMFRYEISLFLNYKKYLKKQVIMPLNLRA